MRHNIIGAVVLIVIGVLFLLENLGFAGIDFGHLISKWWPLILIAVGVSMLFKRRPIDQDRPR